MGDSNNNGMEGVMSPIEQKLTQAIDELMRTEAQHRRLNNLYTLLQVAGSKKKVLDLTEQSRQERRLG
jgi:hypothetical protein